VGPLLAILLGCAPVQTIPPPVPFAATEELEVGLSGSLGYAWMPPQPGLDDPYTPQDESDRREWGPGVVAWTVVPVERFTVGIAIGADGFTEYLWSDGSPGHITAQRARTTTLVLRYAAVRRERWALGLSLEGGPYWWARASVPLGARVGAHTWLTLAPGFGPQGWAWDRWPLGLSTRLGPRWWLHAEVGAGMLQFHLPYGDQGRVWGALGLSWRLVRKRNLDPEAR
jgi:hypothetical protein